ncbi:MAG: Nif11-like leader peptide family natural product precursor [Vulcanococcus sp.]|uniref:Nif11-like leader peptide family natural product precursor n=2 Tax=Synechococcales TaxID=1890424 RepID=UPI001FF92095|nr:MULTISPECIES: Nif11-like leader peptide family natural product precursor [Synechococcaceae]UPH90690.1 Nif11-like leader peptide family natural product precursor [Synechococcus sp. NB0720_010]
MSSAGVMSLKFILKDDPLLQKEVKQCQNPAAICEMARKLGIKLTQADLLRIEAQTTLCLTDEELERWFETPYHERFLISLEVKQLNLAAR